MSKIHLELPSVICFNPININVLCLNLQSFNNWWFDMKHDCVCLKLFESDGAEHCKYIDHVYLCPITMHMLELWLCVTTFQCDVIEL